MAHFLSPAELAKYLGVSTSLIEKNTSQPPEKRIPFIRIGRLVRYELEAVKAFLAKNTSGGQSHVR